MALLTLELCRQRERQLLDDRGAKLDIATGAGSGSSVAKALEGGVGVGGVACFEYFTNTDSKLPTPRTRKVL